MRCHQDGGAVKLFPAPSPDNTGHATMTCCGSRCAGYLYPESTHDTNNEGVPVP